MIFLDLIYKYVVIIKKYLFGFYGNFQTDNFLNYVEYLSWISGSIISLVGLLSIFLSIHYETDLLEAKTILRQLSTENTNSHDSIINSFKKYFFITTDDMKGYIESVTLFKFISIILSILWIFSGIAYIVNLNTYSGIILVSSSTILLCIMFIKIIGKFESVYKKNLLFFPEFFDINKLQKKLNTNYDLGIDILIPTFIIKVFFDDDHISYSYESSVNVFNYGAVLLIRKLNSDGFFFNLGVKISKPTDGIINIEHTLIKNTIHSNTHLKKELCTLENSNHSPYITLFLDDHTIYYKATTSITREENTLVIKCIPNKVINEQVPKPVKSFYSEIVVTNKIFDNYPGISKCAKQKDYMIFRMQQWLFSYIKK